MGEKSREGGQQKEYWWEIVLLYTLLILNPPAQCTPTTSEPSSHCTLSCSIQSNYPSRCIRLPRDLWCNGIFLCTCHSLEIQNPPMRSQLSELRPCAHTVSARAWEERWSFRYYWLLPTLHQDSRCGGIQGLERRFMCWIRTKPDKHLLPNAFVASELYSCSVDVCLWVVV